MFNPFAPNPFNPNPFRLQDVGPLQAAGNLLKAPLDLLEMPGNAVRGTLGAGAKAIDSVVPWSDGSLSKLDNQAAFGEATYRGMMLPGVAAVNPLAKLPEPFAKFVIAQLFDPLNFVGLGIPGAVLKAGKAGPKLAKGLQLLDAVEGKTQDLISGAFGLIPKAAGAAGRLIPLDREIITGVNPDLSANIGRSSNLTGWATSLSKRAYLKQFEGGLQDALKHYKANGGDFAEIDPSLMPTDLAAGFTNEVQAGFGYHVRGLSRDREALEKMFGDIHESRLGRKFDASAFDPEDTLGRFTGLIDSLGVPHGKIGSTVDLLKSVQTHIADQDWNKFDKIVKSYPSGDILKDNPLDLVLDRVVRDRAKMLGIEESTGVKKGWETGTALFSEQALQSISYLLTNALGGTAMGALEGVNPFKVARNLADNFGTAARGEPVFTSGTRDLATALGLLDETGAPILPRTVSAQGAGMLNEANPSRLYTGKGLTAAQEIGAPKLAIGGGLLGGASGYVSSPDDATPGETLTNVLAGTLGGGAVGGAMPTMSKYILQRFARGIEDVMRQSAWETGTRKAVAAQLPDLEKIIRDVYATYPTAPVATPGLDLNATPTGRLVEMLRGMGIEPPTVITGVDGWGVRTETDWRLLEAMKAHAAAGGTVRNPNGRGAPWLQGLLDLAAPRIGPVPPPPKVDVEGMVAAMKDLEGLVAPGSLTGALRDQAGLPDEAARAAGNAWRDLIQQSSTKGADLSNTINFDYSNLNNLESVVRQVVPFSTWAMKAFPFFARHIAENPAILTSALQINRQSAEMREQEGLTARVQGSLPMGAPMDAVWSALLGRDVDTYTNPLRGLVPFSDTLKNLEGVDDADNPLAAAHRAITSFGPSPHPALEFIARTSGLLGTDTPARGLLRAGGPVQGLTSALGVNRGRGVNPEAALPEAEGAIREALSGREVTDLAQTAAERRVDELALKDTGKTITSGDPLVAKYLEAKATHKGEVWDRAMKDTMRERGVRALVGYVSNQAAPSAIVSREEAQIRQARAGLLVPQDLSTEIRDMNARNPMEQVTGETYRRVQQIATTLPPDAPITRDQIQTVLSIPVAANVNWLFRTLYQYEVSRTPEVSAYSGAGTPEQRNLAARLNQYRNLAATIPELQAAPPEQVRALEQLAESYQAIPQGMRPGGVTGKLASSISQRRAQFRAANPDLDAYLAWLAQKRGQGTVEEFVAETVGR